MEEAESVEAFINGSGFPLEYAAAAELKNAGFVPHHGRTYEDKTAAGASAYRDIDILADLPDTRLAMPVQVVVECKRASSPWIALGGEMDPAPAVAAITSSLAPYDTTSAPRLVRGALQIEPPIDFALVAVKTKAKEAQGATDPAFDAVRQLLSAARGVGKRS
jgi:hypothetical protein